MALYDSISIGWFFTEFTIIFENESEYDWTLGMSSDNIHGEPVETHLSK